MLEAKLSFSFIENDFQIYLKVAIINGKKLNFMSGTSPHDGLALASSTLERSIVACT